VTFYILGSLTIDLGPHQRAYPSGRGARILGALLIRGGHAVTLDELVDLLWEKAPPATARQQVQNCASTLDRMLRRHKLPQVQRVANGYQLDITERQLDMLGFERDLNQARVAIAAGDPALAAPRLRTALDYWRGDVLAGLPLGHFEAAAVRLRELRVEALENYFDCELQLGRAAAVVSDLAGATRTYPLRERLISQLMRALAQVGRVIDALELFDCTRKCLVETYGIEPGRLLANALTDVLKQNEAVALENAR